MAADAAASIGKAPSRAGAIARAQADLDSGRLETELARRVACRTQSQTRPIELDVLRAYLSNEMAPSFEALGFKSEIFDNPIEGCPPVFLATRIEDNGYPTVLGYGHGDVILGQEEQWTKGRGPWIATRVGESGGDRIYGRGTADNKVQHSINVAALRAVLEERGGQLGFNSKFMIEMGEETGSVGLLPLVQQHPDDFSADVLIASDGPRVAPDIPTMALGCRGTLNFTLLCDLRDGGHHSGNWGGLLANPGIILAHALSSIIGPTGQIMITEWLPPPMTNAVRSALADIPIDGGEGGPAIDAWWGEPGLTGPEKVYASNSFNVLSFVTGNPDRPVNAVPPKAIAVCQLRYVSGTDIARALPALRAHLDAHGFDRVAIAQPPSSNDDGFKACRTEPDEPWVQWVAASLTRTHGTRPAVIPSTGGSICNNVFLHGLGLPTIWIPHSYAGCSQHAPDEHVLVGLTRDALGLMAGLYWDLGEKGTPARLRT